MEFSCIVPLAGGMPIGVTNSIGTYPKYIISWPDFDFNDRHYINYLKETKKYNVPYYMADEVDYNSLEKVDLVCAVPICKGLSMLSNKYDSSNDANSVMYNCTRIALEKIKPKIYFFENAPLLASQFGRGVADILYKIAEENNYRMLLYRTKSKYHSNPQKRPRTYAFFFNKEYYKSTPLFQNRNIKNVSFPEFLSKLPIPDKNDPMNRCVNSKMPSETAIYNCVREYVKEVIGFTFDTHKDFVRHLSYNGEYVGFTTYLGQKNRIDFAIDYFRKNNNEKELKKAIHVKEKIEHNKNYFAHGLGVSTGEIPAIVAAQLYFLAHPEEDRFLTLRELLSLMGMPSDYNLYKSKTKDILVIYQNVGADIVEDLMIEVKEWLETSKAKRSIENYYVIQDKKSDKIEVRDKIITKIPDNLFG